MGQAFAIAIAETAAEDATGSAAANLCNLCLINPIFNRITVLRHCNKNVADLNTRVKDLEDLKQHVENCKNDAGLKGEVAGCIVLTWLKEAEKLIKDAKELVRHGEKIADRECFFSLCPLSLSRYELSKKAERNLKDIDELEQRAGKFNLLPFLAPPQLDEAPDVEGFEEFCSRKIVLDQIMEALSSSTVNPIGVYGTSGVGKTMLVQMVKQKVKQNSLFTAVVMATVTKDRDLKSIQEDIARDLGMVRLSYTESTDRQVADKIKSKLKDVKKFLVILDDVCEPKIDFEKFGIPSTSEMKQAMEKKNEESSSGQEDMLCKILLTSRSSDVLYRMMVAKDHAFEVRKLEDDEAWHLFKKIVESNVESSDFQPTAKEIVKKCLGLPVAIASVGEAMKGKTQQEEWQNALIELRKPTPEGISEAVYKPIELNYNNLKEKELKQTFILCSLLGRDSSVDDLLKCVVGLDLFQKVTTIEETRAKVLTLVGRLKRSYLLLEGRSSLLLDIHDQIREVALSIAFRDHGGLALVDEAARKKLEDKKTLEKLKWISLPNGDIELPANGLQCPQLTFFYLSNKAQSLEVPSEFLKADELQVLYLTKIDFKSMPSPNPLIPTNLHSLLLDQCVFKVEDLGAIMGNLKNLEVLSLAGCDIEELPREIEKLTKLKLLDVSDCTKLRVIPRQVLASLSKSLEELKMGKSFDQWNVEEGNARLDELAELHKLTALEVCIANFRAISFPENLKRFKIFVEWPWCSWDRNFESSKIMKLKLQGATIKSNDSVKKLLKKTEELYLEGLNGVESLVDELDDEGFQHLKCLQVQYAPDIRRIFNPEGRLLPSHAFPILEVLTLYKLEKMEKICDGLTEAAPFKVLRKVTVRRCHELKNLFSFSVARKLLQLQEIIVEDCSNIQRVIDDVEEQGNGNDIIEEGEGCTLGTLRSLTLRNLPKLISFNSNCGGISLFNDKVEFPKLELMELSSMNIHQIWHNQILENPSSIQKLKELVVEGCSNLKYLLISSMLKSFKQLTILKIHDCKMMEGVILTEELREEERMKEIFFPKLDSLVLQELPKLTRFCYGNFFEFSSLTNLTISKCSMLRTFITNYVIGDTTTSIEIAPSLFDEKECSRLKNLVPSTVYFDKLQTLQLYKCHGFVNLMRYSIAKSLVQLTRMTIRDCKAVSEIVVCADDEVKDAIIFCQLKYLQFFGLPRLASFCSVECNFEFPSLEEVIVQKCPRMKIFSMGEVRTSQLKRVQFRKDKDTWHGEDNLNTTIQKLFTDKVVYSGLENLCLHGDDDVLVETWNENPQEILDFEKLKCLEFINCSSLKYLLTPSMVSSLVQLQDLKLKNCSAMEQVIMVKEVEEGAETELIFPRLNSILLVSCSNLTSLCAATYPLKFPSVIDIAIRDCPNMATYASRFSREHEKEIAKGESEERIEKEEPDIPIEPFLSDKVHFSILERLELTSVGIHQICHSQVPGISPFIENLTELTIERCFNLKYLMTFSMFKSFVQLKKLKIFKCKILEGLILMEGLAEEERMFPKLERLELFDLPKLKRFCSYSDSLEEIYDPQGVNDSGLQATQSTLVQTAATKVVFPRVTYLKLSHLPALKISCPQEDVAKWPLLKYVQATFPCLEELELGWNDIMNEIWYGQHPEEYFCKLKALKLLGFPAFLRPFFFQSLPNLEKLVVIDSFFSELFQCEEVGIEEKPVCGQTLLRELKLSKLHELTHLWKEESQLEPVFNLRTLVVRKCGKLNNLVPSAVYFENLQTLKVSQCHGLVNLVRYSTAKSLVQLTRLQVINCEMIKEIVGCSSDDVKGDIVFTKLEYLRFKGLPRLASFCSGSCNFIFPSLEVVIVRECSKMQNFSVGEVITTKLKKVKLTAYDFGGRWGGNLNHTIQQLFTEKSASDSEDEYSEEEYSEEEYSEEESD